MALPVEGKINEYQTRLLTALTVRMKKLREEILQRKERLEDQLAIIRMQAERDAEDPTNAAR